jgi:phospholipid/cholesterol/gamma-HCH transport system substrate-binding protein
MSNVRHARNATTIAAAIKLGIFTVISVLVTGLLAVIMGNVGFGPGHTYSAIFTNASMLAKGDDVRVAGVSVGEVKDVEHYERASAKITFRVKGDVQLTTATLAEVRFLNLVGDRYLALKQGDETADTEPLEPDATLPVSNTRPALDLTALFNGFKPLFQALTPEQVNDLSLNLVQVMQGEGGTVRSLLEHTASLTTTLANRDKLIGQVVTNLGETLDTVGDRREQLSDLVVELKDWMTDLARDRTTIGSSLDNISDLTVVVADLLRQGRPMIKADIRELRGLATLLNKPKNRGQLVELLEKLPESMTDQLRTGTYGSWYNFYICGIQASFKLPVISDLPIFRDLQKALNSIAFHSRAPRCDL